ncbi:MAG TPA: hypothetical protein VFC44_13485 [Candidatus Saccharimonadales bacterium]|nr:hypothetical protein [Candidatus Saccharimonadales bacterium]
MNKALVFVAKAAAILTLACAARAEDNSPGQFDERFQTLDSSWTQKISSGASIEVTNGSLQFQSPMHGHAHSQRACDGDLITVSAKISQWASLYLVWGDANWVGAGQISPTPFGRLYSTFAVNNQNQEVDHRGIDFGQARWVRIRLGKNYIRFDYSSNGAQWHELRTIERPRELAGAPKFIAVGKYYEADDKPFVSPFNPGKSEKGETVGGRIFEVREEATPPAGQQLTESELQTLRSPRVDVGVALLNASKEDPTYDQLVNDYPPMKYPREAVGVPLHPLDIGVDWLGRLDVSPWTEPTAWLEVGDPPKPLGRQGVPFQRRLLHGYLPVDTLTTTLNGVEYQLTILGWSENLSVTNPLFAYVRLTARSTNNSPLPSQIALAWPGNKRNAWPVAANGQDKLQFCLRFEFPKAATAQQIEPKEFTAKETQITALWEQRLAPSKRFDLPNPRVMEAYQAWFTYAMLNADTINGYIEPHDGAGFYEEMFGNSVSVHTMALDCYGLHKYAAQILDTQRHFQQTNGLYTQVCGLTDPGGFLCGLARHYRMTDDREWLRRVTPNILAQCQWLIRQRKKTPATGVLRGLIKFRPYNDYPDEAYNYLGNCWCAQGMDEVALALKEIGVAEAVPIAAEAKQYRTDILDSMKAAAFEYQGQRLLPLEPDTHRLLKLERYRGGGYYGLSVSPLLGIGLLSPQDERTTWLVDALEKRGGLIAGVCEFEGGIDHAYTYGYLLNELKRGEPRKALLGFWSMLAFGMTRDTYSPVEVSMIETGENHYTLPHLYSCTEQLRLLRALLLREDGNVLQLGEGIPRAWLETGEHVAVNSAPTEFGEVTYRIEAQGKNKMRVTLTPPSRRVPDKIELHLRAPHERRIVSIKSHPKTSLRFSGETIVLRKTTHPVELEVNFAGD